MQYCRRIGSHVTAYFYRFVRIAMEQAGKALLFLFQNNPKTVEILRKVNGFVMNLLMRTPRRPVGMPEKILGKAGVNVAGYITSESGMGEAVRANISSLQHTDIPFVMNNLSSFAAQKDSTYSGFVRKNPFAINLVHVTAEQTPAFYWEQGADYFRNKYNIGMWYWELSKFPEQWQNRFGYFHEIWVATEFCRKAIAEHAPVPVVKIPPSLSIGTVHPLTRAEIGLCREDKVFCCMFSFLSVMERKNPLAIIESFKRAFKPDDNAVLLIKFSHGNVNPQAKALMLEASKGIKVRMIDREMRKHEIYALLSSIDCFISLHRSEGFGLPMAEAMLLKKPVIATAYSGNVDFMNKENSYPVSYKLVELDRDYGPYRKGNVWAEPDITEAAALMREVYEHKERTQCIGERAFRDIDALFNPAATGRIIADRIQSIASDHGMPWPPA